MKIIDFHAHVYPEEIAEKAVENVGRFYNMQMHGGGTVPRLLQEMSDAGIAHTVIHSPALTAANVPTINTFIASQVEKYPQLSGFGTLHADMEDPVEEIDRITGLRLLGIKLHPDSQRFNMDDERMMKLYPILAERKLPVLFHCGDYRYDYSHPRRLVHVLESFPKLTVIGAHFGGWSIPDLALEYLRDKKCYLDISSSLAFIGSVRAKELIRIYGAERLLFGSDFPMWMPKDELRRFCDIGLTEHENEVILHENAERLLGI